MGHLIYRLNPRWPPLTPLLREAVRYNAGSYTPIYSAAQTVRVDTNATLELDSELQPDPVCEIPASP